MYSGGTLSLVLLLSCGALAAQTTGAISGTVEDGDGRPLEAVWIEASSDGLQGARSALSGQDGRFRIALLPPGTYALRVALEGYLPQRIEDLELSLDRTLSMRVTLHETFSDAISVIASASQVDVADTDLGLNLSRETFERLPTERSYASLALLAPAVLDGRLGENPSIRGASAAENRYLVDGFDTTDPVFGTLGPSLSLDLVDAVEIKTGGYGVEYDGALGGIVNVVTRSGTNQLHGAVYGYLGDDRLQADSPASPDSGQALGSSESEAGFSLGGPLRRDRLWYFAALHPTRNRRDLLTRQQLPVTTTDDALQYAVKLTGSAVPGHRLTLSLFGNPSELRNDAVPGAAGLVLQNRQAGAAALVFSWQAVPGPASHLELLAGRLSIRDREWPATAAPSYNDLTSDVRWARAEGCGDPDLLSPDVLFNPGCLGGWFVNENAGRESDRLRLTFNRLATSRHDLELGALYSESRYRFRWHGPGPTSEPVRVTDPAGNPVDLGPLAGQRWFLFDDFALLADRSQNTISKAREIALYVRDSWRVGPGLSLSLGLRASSLRSRGELSSGSTDRRLAFGLGDRLAPRLGVVWDPRGDGASKTFAHYGRYFESVPMDLNATAFNPGEWHFYTFRYPTGGELPGPAGMGTFLGHQSLGEAPFAVDPGIRPMYEEELVVGYERQLAPKLTAGAHLVRRRARDVMETVELLGGRVWWLTNPGGVIDRDPLSGEALASPVTYPRIRRDYRALELTLQRRWGGSWQAFGSYLWSRNEGNYLGLYREDNGSLYPHTDGALDSPSQLRDADGPLPNDRTHQLKLFASARAPLGLVLGGGLTCLSGTPLSRIGWHDTMGPGERFITPRGSAGRTPTLWALDLHLQRAFGLPGGAELVLIADLFNLGDRQAPVAVDQVWTRRAARQTTDPAECGGPGTGPGTACPEGNPAWGEPTAFQRPRSLRLAVRAEW